MRSPVEVYIQLLKKKHLLYIYRQIKQQLIIQKNTLYFWP